MPQVAGLKTLYGELSKWDITSSLEDDCFYLRVSFGPAISGRLKRPLLCLKSYVILSSQDFDA